MEQGASRRRAVPVLAVVLAAVLAVPGLAACTPEPVPTQTGAPVTSTSPSPTPTETVLSAPTHPPEWLTGNNPGAIAAAEYFIELYNYVNATGDLAEWDARSDGICDFCSNVSDDLRTLYAAGGRLEGGTVHVTDGTLVLFSDDLRTHSVQFAFDADEIREYDAQGALVATYSAESGYILLEVGFTGEGWNLVTGNVSDEPLPPLAEESS